MIHLVTPKNRFLYKAPLEAMHRLRHDVLVGEMGWTALRRDDGRDIDIYDHDETSYLLAITDDGEVVGCLRMIASVMPHLLGGTFADMCTFTGVRSGPEILEATRICVRSDARNRPELGCVFTRITCGMLEYALLNSFTEITMMVATRHVPIMQRMGFQITPLGVPQVMDGTSVSAISVPVSRDLLRRIRRFRRVEAPCLGYFDTPAHLDVMPFA